MDEHSSTENIIEKNGGFKDSHTLQLDEDTSSMKKVWEEDEPNSKRNLIVLLLKVVVLALLWAHFIWATYYYFTFVDDTFEETTTSGYGFLVILFSIIHFILIFSYILHPYVVPVLYKFVWAPVAEILAKIPFGSGIFYIAVLIAVIAFLVLDSEEDRTRLIPLSGLAVYVLIGFLLCPFKKAIPWHTVIWGLILQFVFGLLTIRWETGRNIFDVLGQKVNIFLGYAVEGAAFVYSDELVYKIGAFAFKSLATVYFLGFMINILYFYGIMQDVVALGGRFLQWTMGTSVCESVNSAANIFLGMTEAPLLLKPYLTNLTDSEIHSVMTAGFATVSGTVLAAYTSFGADPAHLITASVMSAPAALCYSKLMYPETEEILTTAENVKKVEVEYDSVLDAAAKGAHDAYNVVMGIISSLVSFLAFIYFVNGVLGWMGELVGFHEESDRWSVELFTGKIFIPISYIMGVPWEECEKVGQLIGVKTMVNEFAAFQKMGGMVLLPKSKVIATYCICGFANPGSIGIMISTLGGLVPQKREAVTRLVFRAFLGGSFTCFMTACVAATLIPSDYSK